MKKTDGFSVNPQSLIASRAIRPIGICQRFYPVYPTWIPLSSGSKVFSLFLQNYPPTNQFLNQVKQTEWQRQGKKKKGKWISVGSGMVSLVYLPRRKPCFTKKAGKWIDETLKGSQRCSEQWLWRQETCLYQYAEQFSLGQIAVQCPRV